MDLFEHQVAFRQLAYSKRESEHKISDSLACSPHTSHQRSLMSLDYHLKIQGDLMADSGEAGFSLQKAAQVRLDNLGLVKNHSCFINNPKRIKLLEQRLELQRSIGRSEEIRKSTAIKKELAELDKLSPMLFQGIAMYKANETTKRVYKGWYQINSSHSLWNHTTKQRKTFIQIRVVEVITATGKGQSWEDRQPSCC